MRKTSKIISSFLALLISVMSFGAVVSAAEGTIAFEGQGKALAIEGTGTFTATDLFGSFKNVMPGDVLTEKIQIVNRDAVSDYVNIYIRADVHDETTNPLSEEVKATGETVATMSDYLSQLYMKVYCGEKLIYEASPDEKDGLAENVLLGTFRSGEATNLIVELEIPKSLGNEYAYRTGEVDWVFVVEAFDKPAPEEIPDTPDTEDTPESPDLPPLIQTGQLNWPILVLIGLGLMLIMVGIVFSRKRKEEHA